MSNELEMKVISSMTAFGLGFEESRRLIRHLEAEDIGFIIKAEPSEIPPALSEVEKFAGVKIPGGRLAMLKETMVSIVNVRTQEIEIRSSAAYIRGWVEITKETATIMDDATRTRITVEDFLKIELI